MNWYIDGRSVLSLREYTLKNDIVDNTRINKNFGYYEIFTNIIEKLMHRTFMRDFVFKNPYSFNDTVMICVRYT